MAKIGKTAFSGDEVDLAVIKDKSMDDLNVADLPMLCYDTPNLAILYHIPKKWREILNKVIPHVTARVAVSHTFSRQEAAGQKRRTNQSFKQKYTIERMKEIWEQTINHGTLPEGIHLQFVRETVYGKDILEKMFFNLDIDLKYIVDVIGVVSWPIGAKINGRNRFAEIKTLRLNRTAWETYQDIEE